VETESVSAARNGMTAAEIRTAQAKGNRTRRLEIFGRLD